MGTLVRWRELFNRANFLFSTQKKICGHKSVVKQMHIWHCDKNINFVKPSAKLLLLSFSSFNFIEHQTDGESILARIQKAQTTFAQKSGLQFSHIFYTSLSPRQPILIRRFCRSK